MTKRSCKKQLGYKVANTGLAMMMFGCAFVFCLILASVLMPLLMKIIHRQEAALRIVTVMQDILLFVIPAIAASFAATRLPARLLAIDRRPDATVICGALGVLLLSVPAMNFIIEWNQQIHLPQSMALIEQFFRQMEQSAADATSLLMGGSSVGSLIMSLLIVAVLAGFSEELFFRGALQRILMSTSINTHVCIWMVAVIFSAFHFQFFGFVPRLILGAYFGYLLWWTRNLWVPVCVHIFNNALVVIFTWKTGSPEGDADSLASYGSDLSDGGHIAVAAVSIILSAIALRLLYLLIKKKQHLAAPAHGSTDQTA